MARTVVVAVEEVEEFARRAVAGDLMINLSAVGHTSRGVASIWATKKETHRIGRRPQTIKRVSPLVVRMKDAHEIMLRLIGILLLIQSYQPHRQQKPLASTYHPQVGEDPPFVLACQTSTLAPFNGLPLTASVTTPCMSAILPSSGSFNTVVSPFLRVGVSCRQKGPRMAEGVAEPAEAAACL